ncbi:MAG TPA: hypothetical protein VEJ44_05695 [Acidimicrobiales bacterium]|nr:hypothetical protein [Acidimicrobiales bacterium]
MVHGRGMGRRPAGPAFDAERVSLEDVRSWLTGRLPEDWFEGTPEVTVDRDEILVVGHLAPPELPADADEPAHAAAEAGRISRFREDTRDRRMAVAREAEHRFGRTISWGAESGSTSAMFTNLSVPVMTRLRQPERRVLDTLVDSGVARSRSDALAWCVKLVSANTDEWLEELRSAMEAVETVRDQGPSPR